MTGVQTCALPISRPMFGFKSFRCARILICGIEPMHMIRKGQLRDIKEQASYAANPFYSLAFLIATGLAALLGLIALLRQNQTNYAAQALPWSAWKPLLFASASLMSSPRLVLP